jgi:hypothetical protein
MRPKNCPHGASYRYGNYDINSDKPTEYWCSKCEEERLRKENAVMRKALETIEQACSAPYLVSSWDVLCLARSALEELERGE